MEKFYNQLLENEDFRNDILLALGIILISILVATGSISSSIFIKGFISFGAFIIGKKSIKSLLK